MLNKLKQIYNKIINLFIDFYHDIICAKCILFIMSIIFPIKKNKILINNYQGNDYGDGAKYIVDYIIKNERDYEIIWLLRKELIKKNNLPKEVKPVSYYSLKSLYEISTSKVWIDNCRKVWKIFKRNQQKYIQIWHGNLVLKKVEFDAKDVLPRKYKLGMIYDNKIADYFVSNSFATSNMFRNSFKYNGIIKEFGSPRNDVLFNNVEEFRIKVYKKLGFNIDDKILLYAPTFRRNYEIDCYNIDLENLKKFLEKNYNVNWRILVRLHPNMQDYKIFDNIQNVIDVTNYPDMQELICACDILITDYSSVMFEAMMAKKKVYLYASDIDIYQNDDRGFYFELKELPFPLAINNAEMEYNIKLDSKYDFNAYNNFSKKLGIIDDGHASERIVKLIDDIIGDVGNE